MLVQKLLEVLHCRSDSRSRLRALSGGVISNMGASYIKVNVVSIEKPGKGPNEPSPRFRPGPHRSNY